MVKINISEYVPDYALKVMEALLAAGYEAYLVGGAVRDLYWLRQPEDYDITTNARPDEVMQALAASGIETTGKLGKAFGVVIAVVGKNTVEVASYRKEVYGADAHRPEKVWYCDDLKEDLARRDFTVNAMAIDREGNLIDYFGGWKDLSTRALRTVGNPDERFAEDALRMFRACRFVSQLGMEPEEKLVAAITHNLHRVEGLSLERVRNELDKLLLGHFAADGLRMLVATGLAGECCRQRVKGTDILLPILPELEKIVAVPQNPAYHKYDVWEHTLAAVNYGAATLTVRWAILLHDIAKGQPGIRSYDEDGLPRDPGHEAKSAEMAREILTRLRYNESMINLVCWMVGNHMRYGTYITREDAVSLKWLRQTARSGMFHSMRELVDAFQQLANVCEGDIAACNSTPEELLACQSYRRRLVGLAIQMPVHTSDLFITGDEVATIVTERKQVGVCMRALLQRVQDGNVRNDPDELLAKAKTWWERQLHNK